MKSFDVRLIEKLHQRYVEAVGDRDLIECEKDIVALIGLCAEFNADRILLHGDLLTNAFFDLKSGHAGMILQKLVNYQIKTAVVLRRDQVHGKFGEFVVETNHGRHFRVFFDREEAESWLLTD